MTQPETRLQRRVQAYLKGSGAYVWKVHGNEFTPVGLPDIVGVWRSLFIAVETKEPGERLSTVQEYRVQRLRMAGAFVLAPCYNLDQVKEFVDALEEYFTKGSSRARDTYGRDARI